MYFFSQDKRNEPHQYTVLKVAISQMRAIVTLFWVKCHLEALTLHVQTCYTCKRPITPDWHPHRTPTTSQKLHISVSSELLRSSNFSQVTSWLAFV